jgi:hypothetical protein
LNIAWWWTFDLGLWFLHQPCAAYGDLELLSWSSS